MRRMDKGGKGRMNYSGNGVEINTHSLGMEEPMSTCRGPGKVV